MIVRFSVENWMSFRGKAELSMIASRERQHRERVSRVEKYRMGILPIAAVYGGNASGKTNFFKALSFARKFVVGVTQPDSLIPVQTFRLDEDSREHPVRFSFELLIGETIYEYVFAVTSSAVIEEKLVEITSSAEKILFDRRDGEPNFCESLGKDDTLRVVFRGTRDNQLFLTNSVSQKVEVFSPVYSWFRDSLLLLTPESRFQSFEQFLDRENLLNATMCEILLQFDTGISHLGGENISFELLPLPDEVKTKLEEDVKENVAARIDSGPRGECFLVTRKNKQLQVQKLVAFHPRVNGSDVPFELRDESDGTRRVIDLLPAFLALSSENNKVVVIDEIDRSLHTLLTRRLLEMYLGGCSPESRTQLLFTTHDVLQMDQDMLRRDEMWVTERNALGESRLYSFSEYKDVRYDKDIRKSYLQGRLGGIPKILFCGACSKRADDGSGND
jgi:AAA15 family ATPase/GTPase